MDNSSYTNSTKEKENRTVKFKTSQQVITKENYQRLAEMIVEPKPVFPQIGRKSLVTPKIAFNFSGCEKDFIKLPDIEKYVLRSDNKEIKDINPNSNYSKLIKPLNSYRSNFKNGVNQKIHYTPILESSLPTVNYVDCLSPNYRIFKEELKDTPDIKIKLIKYKKDDKKNKKIPNFSNQEEDKSIAHDTLTRSHGPPILELISKSSQNEMKQDNNSVVSGYFCKEEINNKYKRKMEDFHRVIKRNEDEMLFILMDGHGGDKVAKYVKERYPDIFFVYLVQNEQNVEKSLQESIRKIESELYFPKAREMGTTLSIIYIYKDSNQTKHLYSANVGDSRCLLVSEGKINRITYDHRIDDQSEKERIIQAGGCIQNGRLMGIINLSRTIGDLELKKYGLISTPNIFQKELDKHDKFVLMASDGVWDVISDTEVLGLYSKNQNAEEYAEEIVKRAVLNGSRDNISCLAIKL